MWVEQIPKSAEAAWEALGVEVLSNKGRKGNLWWSDSLEKLMQEEKNKESLRWLTNKDEESRKHHKSTKYKKRDC